jgi:hypothetical protein
MTGLHTTGKQMKVCPKQGNSIEYLAGMHWCKPGFKYGECRAAGGRQAGKNFS